MTKLELLRLLDNYDDDQVVVLCMDGEVYDLDYVDEDEGDILLVCA